MATRIRVLRLVEYSYDSAETMVHDMSRWTLQHTTPNGHIRIRSTALPPDVIKDEPAESGKAGE